MKRSVLTFILLAQLSFIAFSQKEVIFKVKYKPETTYSETTDQSSLTEIKYIASDDLLQKLKDKGIQNPTVTNNQSTLESVFKTGKLTDASHFPLTMEITKTASSDGKKVIPDGTIIYGHDSIGSLPVFDSIVTKDLDDDIKKMVLKSIQSIFDQISFPEKKVKIGSSFSYDTPLTMPIASITLEMKITTTYKLISISNGIANFDITQVYTMKTEVTKYKITAAGTGKGQLQYDIANDFYRKYQIDSEMKMFMKMENLSLDLTSKSGFVQTTAITPN